MVVRMDRGPKDRGRSRGALPITLRMTTLVFLDADFVVAKDSMETSV